ncbi:hypothetical protein ACNKH9_23225 [Metapseudomonas otitidis]|uniref:hypothetical protein n=1 Tax=Metapseudomonas otitidis TaxID=319939 RepID=UPI003A85BC71
MSTSIRVYLDSSDFSNLSQPSGKNTALMRNIRSKLINWVKKGEIEIRYSMAHIMEAVPVDLKTAELGRRRLDCIRQLCGKKVFTDPITLVTQELSQSSDVPLTSDRGHWFPGMTKLWDETVDLTPEPLDSRNERRLLRSAIKSDAQFNNELQDLLDNYPITKKYAVAWLTKQQPGDSVARAIQNSVSDLDFLCEWYIKHWNKSTLYSTAIREQGKEFSGLLTTAARDMKALHLELENEGVKSSEAQKRLTACAKKLAENMSQEVVDGLSKEDVPPASIVSASLESTPSIYVFSELLTQIFLTSVVTVKNTRKARDSDLGDLMHSIYLPYVDIFRADGATASALHNAQIGTTAKIVTSLEDLVTEVEARITLRKQSKPISV